MEKYKYSKQVYLGRDGNGKEVRKRVYANSKAELARKTEQLKAQCFNSTVPINISFGDYSERWVEVYKSNRSVNTVRMYTELLRLTDDIRPIPIREITPSLLQQLITDNWEHAETCKKLCMTLKAIFKRAIQDGLIVRDPSFDLERPKVVQKEKRALTEKEKTIVRELISVDDARLPMKHKLFLAMLYYFGLRPEEARALMPADFDFDNHLVTIQRATTFDVNKAFIKGTKTENVRKIPIPHALVPLLTAYLKQNKALYLFTAESGTIMSKTVYTRFWRRIRTTINEALGGSYKLDLTDGLTPYTFRRNYATILYYSDVSIKKAAYYMGHVDTKMILKVYAQIDDSKESMDYLLNIV